MSPFSGHQLTRLYGGKDGCHASELGIKVARVGRAGDLRLEWRRHLLISHVVPIDVPEEGMAHDLLSIRRAGAKAQLGLARE